MSEFVQLDHPDQAVGPLAERVARSGPVQIRALDPMTYINLRGRSDDAAFLDACESVLGLVLPVAANRCVRGTDLTISWLGPSEWLLHGSTAVAGIVERLETALAGTHHALNDVSGGYAGIELSGSKAAALLARGCSLDLHASAFGGGECRQTHIARAVVLILKTDDKPRFEVVVRRSFARYLWDWLDDVNSRLLVHD